MLALFCTSLGELITKGNKENGTNIVNNCPWPLGSEKSPAPSVPEPKSSSNATGPVADPSHPVYVCEQHGFKVGDFCIEKGVTDEVYELTQISGAGIALKSRSLWKETVVVKVDIGSFVPKWKLGPRALQTRVGTDDSLAPLVADVCYEEMVAKFHIYKSLRALAPAVLREDLGFYLNPKEIRNTSPIPMGELKLHAYTPFNSISSKDNGGTCCEYASKRYQLQAPKTIIDLTSEKKDVMMVAFWWVGTTPDESAANMELTYSEVEGVRIPAYANKVELPKYSKLCCFRASTSQVSVRARAASSQPNVCELDSGLEEPSKKKAKGDKSKAKKLKA